MTLHCFCCKLVLQLIDNDWLRNEEEQDGGEGEESVRESKRNKLRVSAATHDILTAPLHAKSFVHNKWLCTATLKHAQFTCRGLGCTKHIQTYCKCNPSEWLCTGCFLKHFKECIWADVKEC